MAKVFSTIPTTIAAFLSLFFVFGCQYNTLTDLSIATGNTRSITVEDYLDKMKAGWIGQMAGVGWGGPTEFRYKGQIIPEDKMPQWKPELINQFMQDDIYVEMTFLRSLELHGFDCSIRQAGIDFANSGYSLWHANRNGRDNLCKGIAPPDSGHPEFNAHADDIDYQIEADYAGLIAPGMPNVAIKLGEKFGRLMNYGDGLYGGQFVGGMYAEAFFEDNMLKIVQAGLKCIPAKSQYAECIRDVFTWYKENPDDWEKTWHLIEEKYQDNPEYRRFSCDKGDFNIDAKINGAYIVMGLLYGQGDPDKTIIISTRCGQDSDCNPSNAGGILFTTIGFKNLPDKFKSALNPEGKFSHTPYNFPRLVEVSEKLVRQAVKRQGGRIMKNMEAQEAFIIPIRKPKPGKLEQCWEPGPIANSKFTKEELAKIKNQEK
ncbi:MAG: ADP-ribosylglycohydrolase family protein [Sedimentisphaerales bacterium]|nr:ADP-ribosylglycohydrolase family protein [Sedimentisphaerales bacterium]